MGRCCDPFESNSKVWQISKGWFSCAKGKDDGCAVPEGILVRIEQPLQPHCRLCWMNTFTDTSQCWCTRIGGSRCLDKRLFQNSGFAKIGSTLTSPLILWLATIDRRIVNYLPNNSCTLAAVCLLWPSQCLHKVDISWVNSELNVFEVYFWFRHRKCCFWRVYLKSS